MEKEDLLRMAEVLDTELRGKHLLLVAGYGMELYRMEKTGYDENVLALSLELDELEETIKTLKKVFRKQTGEYWGKRMGR